MNCGRIDLTKQAWELYGTMPFAWHDALSLELGLKFKPEIGPIPVSVPGSVQQALIDAGIVENWKYDLYARNLEWIENRHWVYSCSFTNEMLEENERYELVCEGLDYAGWVYLNSTLVGTFNNSFIPHRFTISPKMLEKNNQLHIIFREPPRWLGQLGYTSQIRDWKPRFNYTWDWVVRVVQIGITGTVELRPERAIELQAHMHHTSYDPTTQRGMLEAEITCSRKTDRGCRIVATVCDKEGNVLASSTGELSDGKAKISITNLAVLPWWPNQHGAQPLYTVSYSLIDSKGQEISQEERTVGFAKIQWLPCEGAVKNATPWICCVNGKPIFLQGINWTPISPTYADVSFEEIQKRLLLYKELGCNIVRVWGGAVLEREDFYKECDRLGMFVWQELPLSSSGLDNWPPENPHSIDEIAEIAKSYIARRASHISLLMWCGGNELQGSHDGAKSGSGKPIDFSHPMMKRLKGVFETLDPYRRFIPTSPFGPRFKADPKENNQGLHWSVHGPWNSDQVLDHRWSDYWEQDDSLLRAETGFPGAMEPDILQKYVLSYALLPIKRENPIWGRNPWWIESDVFEQEFGRPPHDVHEYCAWSQERQAKALEIAVKATKKRFPACGGIIIWMGHDCFPCAANTSIIDVEGNPKPAYYAVQKVFCTLQEQVQYL